MTRAVGCCFLLLWLSGCGGDAREVVVYTALDPVFSRQILREFEKETGIRVREVFDTEATKTTGLAERLKREKARPRCDVFWSNEILRTIRLSREGIFQPHRSSVTETIPAEFASSEGLWYGFAARARAVAYDPQGWGDDPIPRRHWDLVDPRWKGRLVMADPRFGTTGSHLACLLAAWGEAETRRFLEGLAANDVRIVAGNSTSRDRVVDGSASLGLTDTDDIEVVRRKGVSIAESLFEEEGTVVLPNTVALVKGGPNPAEGRRLLDYLLSPSVEERLAASPSRQIPVRASVPVPASGLRLANIRRLELSFESAADALPDALRLAEEILR